MSSLESEMDKGTTSVRTGRFNALEVSMDAGMAFLVTLIGLVSCFFGYPLFRMILIFAGLIGGYLIGQSCVPTGYGWVAILAGISGGVIMAVLAYPLWSIGVFVIGSILGILILSSIAIVLNTSLTVVIILGMIGAGVMGSLFYIVRDFFVMLSTALFGAVEMVYGIGYFIPILTFRHGTPNVLALAVVLVLGSIGFLAQYILFKDRRIYPSASRKETVMVKKTGFRLNVILFFLVMFMVAAAGCAGGRGSQKTLGELMLEKGKEAQELGKRWNKANQIVVEGEKLIETGEKQVEREKKEIE